jgi:YgiT-type zinc finger domain-containing protein
MPKGRPKKNKDEEIIIGDHKIVLKATTRVFCPECGEPRISGVQWHKTGCSKSPEKYK